MCVLCLVLVVLWEQTKHWISITATCGYIRHSLPPLFPSYLHLPMSMCPTSGRLAEGGGEVKKLKLTHPRHSFLASDHKIYPLLDRLLRGQESAKNIRKACHYFFKNSPPAPLSSPIEMEFRLIAAVVCQALKNPCMSQNHIPCPLFDINFKDVVDWDAEEYSRTVTSSVVQDGPPSVKLAGQLVLNPRVIVDKKGRIVAWYLPGIIGRHRIVSSLLSKWTGSLSCSRMI